MIAGLAANIMNCDLKITSVAMQRHVVGNQQIHGKSRKLFGKLNLNMFAAGCMERAGKDLSCGVLLMCHCGACTRFRSKIFNVSSLFTEVKINDNKIYCAIKSSLESFFANDEWKTVY